MSQKIIALKLTSGEEIIARLEEHDEETLTLDRPMTLGIGASPEDPRRPVIQMMPWLVSNQDGNCKVNRSHVVAQIIPHAELEKGYLTQTSGIQL